jgi:hypothetical protein
MTAAFWDVMLRNLVEIYQTVSETPTPTQGQTQPPIQ